MSRRNASRRSPAGKPPWVWFVLGNFVGGFAVFMIFVSGLEPAQPGAQPRQQTDQQPQQTRFDFYTLLRDSEVSVPPPKTARPARRLDGGSSSGAGNPAPQPAQPVGVNPNYSYILQAASFRDAKEAEKLRARLTLANLDVKVETATDSRGTWHRVLVGPYRSRSQMAKARQVLADHRLMPLVLKRPHDS
ncbi:SPOR domain-containing protein [Microbulbifer sp. 2201CG32-9]|uniref:SPOR domain-containing protein n=1 Tax=Microbulbifer sp. 2201CG32-9 TaxID=3232309 RepID=UPI00345C1BAB